MANEELLMGQAGMVWRLIARRYGAESAEDEID
jgi:hypothetical protein